MIEKRELSQLKKQITFLRAEGWKRVLGCPLCNALSIIAQRAT
jgi:hypothetical protein